MHDTFTSFVSVFEMKLGINGRLDLLDKKLSDKMLIILCTCQLFMSLIIIIILGFSCFNAIKGLNLHIEIQLIKLIRNLFISNFLSDMVNVGDRHDTILLCYVWKYKCPSILFAMLKYQVSDIDLSRVNETG